MTMARKGFFCCAVLLAVVADAVASYPERPLTLVVPFPVNGTPDISGSMRINRLVKVIQTFSPPSLTDTLANQVGQALRVRLGQSVKLDRRPAGKTIAGARHAALARADGYTLLLAGNPTITIYPALYRRLPFDPMRDFVPVASVARMPIALIATRNNAPFTVRELIERARRFPGSINFGSVGDGTTAHLTGELFRAAGAVNLVHVSYNGGNSLVNAVITGQIELGFAPLPAVMPYLGGRKLWVVALASETRHPMIPDVSTIGESGLPGFEASGWFGVFAPAHTSGAIVSLLNYEINRSLAEESRQVALERHGLEAALGSPEEFSALIRKDYERWSRVVRIAESSN